MINRFLLMTLLGSALTVFSAASDPLWLEFAGDRKLPGSGTRVVLISGDEEYRSEESMPMLAKSREQRKVGRLRQLMASPVERVEV